MQQILCRFVIFFIGFLSVGTVNAVPPPQQIGVNPIFGPICAGPLGPGPCADVHRYLMIQAVAVKIKLKHLGFNPVLGDMCEGPLGPGPCRQIQIFIATQQVAMNQVTLPSLGNGGICLGPLGPGPCGAVKAYIMHAQSGVNPVPQGLNLSQPMVLPQRGPNGEPMCLSPFGPTPCNLIAQFGLDAMNGGVFPVGSFGIPPGIKNTQVLAQECAKRAGMDVNLFALCAGQKVVLPPQEHAVLDCAVSTTTAETFAACAAPKLGYSLSNDQQKTLGCAIKSKGGETNFKSCMGSEFLNKSLSADEQAFLKCASNNTDPVAFGKCAAVPLMSNNQKAMLNCAASTSDAIGFTTCAMPYSGIKMSDDQRILVNCSMKAKGNEDSFMTCAGTAFLKNKLGPNEQRVLGCAASAAGDAAKFAGCSAGTLFGKQLSQEQQVAIQCAVQSQGDPSGFATCAGANMFNLQLNPEQQIVVQCIASTGGQPYAAAGCMGSRLTARELSKCLANGIGGQDGCFGDIMI